MKTALDDAVKAFLASRSFAVTGVSRSGDTAASFIFGTFKKRGLKVYPVNPNAKTVQDVDCFPDVQSLPESPEAVVIAGPASATMQTVEICILVGVKHIWMHRSLDAGSVDDKAVALARSKGISVIDGACPMMYLEPVDFGHRCFKWWMNFSGKLPLLESNPSQA